MGILTDGARRPEMTSQGSDANGIQWKIILSLNAIGLLCFLLWYFSPFDFWRKLDEACFYFFNQFTGVGHVAWERILARLNMRAFDAIAALILGCLLLWSVLISKGRKWPDVWLYWAAVGLLMVIVGLAIKFFAQYVLYSYQTRSPTYILPNARLLSDYVTDFRFRDSATSCFPGDHGMILMTSSICMWRFARRPVAWVSVLLVVLLSAPRIMVGAHWFSDIYAGSLIPSFLIAPWVFFTPVGPNAVAKIRRALESLLARWITATSKTVP